MTKQLYFIIHNSAIKFSLCLFLFLIPFDLGYSNIALGIALGLFFVGYPFLHNGYTKNNGLNFSKLFSSTFIFYIFIVLSLFYSSSLGEVNKFIEYRISMLLIPLMFFAGFRLTSRETEMIMSGFMFGVLLRLLYVWLLAIYGLSIDAITINQLSFTPINILDTIFKSHRTYLSFYGLTALVIAIGSRNILYPTWFKIITAFIVLTSVFSFESRAIIGIAAAMTIVFPFFVSRGRKLIKLILITYAVLIASSVIPFISGSYNNVKERIITTKEELHTESATEMGISYDPRASRWAVALELIGESPLIGYGAGAEKDVLKKKYIDKNLIWSAEQSLDVHNQFLSFALENGVLATLFYGYMLLFIFIKGIKQRDFIAVCFILICVGMSLFENILNVNWMITFFAFMSSIFIFQRRSISD